MLRVDGKPQRYNFSSQLEFDGGDVLTTRALGGCVIINKPVFEISQYLEKGELTPVALKTPPTSLPFVGVYPHKRLQDHKVLLFIDPAVSECKRILAEE